MRGKIVTLFIVLTASQSLKEMRVYWGNNFPLVEPWKKFFAHLRCVCTWCPFKSSKYSVVKKHIEIHHERKHHYPCKECVFVGQSVDDYAEHYHTFHKVSFIDDIFSANLSIEHHSYVDGRVQTCMHRLLLQMYQQTRSQGDKSFTLTILINLETIKLLNCPDSLQWDAQQAKAAVLCMSYVWSQEQRC